MNILQRIIRKVNSNRSVLLSRAKVKQVDKNILHLLFPNVDGFYLPYSSAKNIDQRQLNMVSKGLSEWLIEKYTTDIIGIRNSDVVIDCGAFVGGFTIAASRAGARMIYSVEPSSRNFKCFNLNIAELGFKQKVTPLNIALGNKNEILSLNLSESGCDDSLLEPDEGDLKTVEKVQVKTLKEIISTYKIDPTNLFLKVEAEGFEPEVIYGLGEYKPRVIVVDITPERDGRSPKNEITEHLQDKGYVTLETDRCLFATFE